MNFISINEYFYKFASTLMMILLLPIIIFVMGYFLPVENQTDFSIDPEGYYIVVVLLVLWILNFFFFNKKIKSVRKGQGLRYKLEKYFSVTIVRYMLFSICSVGLGVGFYLTRNDFFMLLFIAQLILCGVLWPGSKKVSSDLKLRGDEREMVYYKKDTL